MTVHLPKRIVAARMWNSELVQLSAYSAVMAVIWGLYWSRRSTLQRRSLGLLQAATEAGLHDPPSLHPLIDVKLCIGCRSCVTACPEGDILGVINGKARLVNPSHCIGHGACLQAPWPMQ